MKYSRIPEHRATVMEPSTTHVKIDKLVWMPVEGEGKWREKKTDRAGKKTECDVNWCMKFQAHTLI